ncbi:hypothetical protein B0H16DRAFT_1454203 [Mycena metata]|uniref:Uncharacterized protein n=1 Tax=Mycena metata TaxID=1033252 RepID=A0AAD7JJ76_9AGAR|nr:hypothetical protein B0H16DRAFT_1454203 [Mycena metata]
MWPVFAEQNHTSCVKIGEVGGILLKQSLRGTKSCFVWAKIGGPGEDLLECAQFSRNEIMLCVENWRGGGKIAEAVVGLLECAQSLQNKIMLCKDLLECAQFLRNEIMLRVENWRGGGKIAETVSLQNKIIPLFAEQNHALSAKIGGPGEDLLECAQFSRNEIMLRVENWRGGGKIAETVVGLLECAQSSRNKIMLCLRKLVDQVKICWSVPSLRGTNHALSAKTGGPGEDLLECAQSSRNKIMLRVRKLVDQAKICWSVPSLHRTKSYLVCENW